MLNKASTPAEKIVKVLGYIFMAVCLIVALFPIVWVILSSFKSNKEIMANGLALPTSFAFTG